LLVSLGFLLVPGPPLDRPPAYLLVALRPRPTLAHFDPERVTFWSRMEGGTDSTSLEWPLSRLAASYSWGAIEVVDRVGASNRFASFGGSVNVALDHDVHAVLFRSDAPILCAGGHSGPADPLADEIVAFFGILRAAAGNSPHLLAQIQACSPLALYGAFLARSIDARCNARLMSRMDVSLASLLRQEERRLDCQAPLDLQQGRLLDGLLHGAHSQIPRR
jgi:hypothetical protein